MLRREYITDNSHRNQITNSEVVVPGTCSGARETAQWTKALARKLGVSNSVPGTYEAERKKQC